VVRRSREISLDPAYVYGLIRQESRFVMDAVHVGAAGLMQVMPATARWTARKLGMNSFTVEQLTDRETNVAIGTGYLKLVLDDFGGSMPMAAAAYNAGPGRPRSWRNGPVMKRPPGPRTCRSTRRATT
jgi:soluble lytic murein transglycosylase